MKRRTGEVWCSRRDLIARYGWPDEFGWYADVHESGLVPARGPIAGLGDDARRILVNPAMSQRDREVLIEAAVAARKLRKMGPPA